MKEYRVSLEMTTSPAVSGLRLAELLGIPPLMLSERRRKSSTLWRCESAAGRQMALAEQIHRLALDTRPLLALSSIQLKKASLNVEVRYDTMTCTVRVPLRQLLFGRESLLKSLPALQSIELRCCPSDEDLVFPVQVGEQAYDPDRPDEEIRQQYQSWQLAGRPAPPKARFPLAMAADRGRRGGGARGPSRKEDARSYMVSLNAITSAAATADEVADVLGLPSDSLTWRGLKNEEGTAWRCEVEADQTIGLGERIRFLASQVHPRRPFDPDGDISEIYLDVGVIYDVRRSEVCSARLPVPSLRALVRKIPVFCVELSCYPWDREAD